jgi:glycolate oxidase FAD binding subunit
LAEAVGAQPLAGDELAEGSDPPSKSVSHDSLICQASVLPTQVPTLIEALDRDAPGAFLTAAPITGVVSATWLGIRDDKAFALLARLRATASNLGGTVTVVHCSPELKREIDVFGDTPPSFELMRLIKHEFDSNGILSPGRFVGKL